MHSSPDVAIVTTVHNEGRDLVPTLHALDRTIANAAPLAVEVVVVQDSADEATRRAVADAIGRGVLRHAARVETLDVDHGDLASSRNEGITRTDAPFVGVLDADNLPSETWIAAGFALLSVQSAPAIAHPEVIITFGAKREVWPLISSTAPEFDPGWISWFNPWDAFVIADRRVFDQVPYRVTRPGSGFGPEDWAWNSDTLAAGFEHLTVSGTALFYRATDHGLAAAHHGSLVPASPLLSSKVVATRALKTIADDRERNGEAERVPKWRRTAHAAVRAGARLTRPLRHRLQPGREAPVADLLYGYREEWAQVHRLQPMLPYPSMDIMRGYRAWGTDWPGQFLPEREAYWTAVATLPERVDALFIVPWVRTGGADLLTVQYIESMRRQCPDAVIALVTTEPERSTRLSGIEGVSVFELGRFALLPQFGVRVLGTLIAQLRPTTVHVINSTLGFDVLDRYSAPLTAHSALFASTFVIDTLPDGASWSFLHHRSRSFYERLSGVLTDNHRLVEHMVDYEGAPADAFTVHHAVVATREWDRASRPSRVGSPLRVAWAGRFDRQKRLDRLVEIVRASSGLPIEYHVYGDAVIGDDSLLESTLAQLNELGVVRHGSYTQGFAVAVAATADVLLLTSDSEGLPNTLLEAFAEGVSVVAPNVGDIARVLTSRTGYLVDDPGDIAGYVRALAAVQSDPDEASIRAQAAHALVRAEFSANEMDRTLASLPGYLPARGRRAQSYQWYADEHTADFLRSGNALTLVYTGSNGHSNFGDILQNKNIIAYWNRRADRAPVLFLPAFAASSVERTAALRRWFDCPHIVFFAPVRTAPPSGLVPIEPPVLNAPVHVVGGGYLNARWGEEHFRAIDAIASDFGASQVFFTGLQVDEGAVEGFEQLGENHQIPFIGLRDAASLRLVSSRVSTPALDTFDDLTEVLAEWSTTPWPSADLVDGPRVAIHMNTSDYAGGPEALERWRDALRRVADLKPREVVLLTAYSDSRTEVRDTLGTVAALAEDFPFVKVTLVDIARAALDSCPGGGRPVALDVLAGVDFGLSSSYHTALMLSFFGIPTYLMGANAYFGQKAELFQLPSLSEFLERPDRYRLDLGPRRAVRERWLQQLDAKEFLS